MGRAIVRDPQVFLFDEPLSNLDAKLRVTMRVEIKELHQRLKTTTVYVTHDQIEAMTMAEQDRGHARRHRRADGQAARPLRPPANLFVAGFIGSPSMNFLEGRATERGFETGGLLLPLPPLPAATIGKTLSYGIRPEHFKLVGRGIPVEVKVLEPTGSETQIVADAGGREITCVFRERVVASAGEVIDCGCLEYRCADFRRARCVRQSSQAPAKSPERIRAPERPARRRVRAACRALCLRR
jgi:multiple sugar transport system ATP-binding protein